MRGPDVSWYLIVFGDPVLDRHRQPVPAPQPADRLALARDHAQLGESRLDRVRRLHGKHDGQIFALAVMAVAASEVVVGLGLIVAVARKRLDLDVDRLRVLRG